MLALSRSRSSFTACLLKQRARIRTTYISPVKHNKQSLSSNVFVIGKEVSKALENQRPIIALESTIITHGMPYPHNLETALTVEEIIREKGVVPATVAVLDGRLVVGASKSEIEYLATRETGTMKISRRDLAYSLKKGQYGGTTVSATMIAAHKAGIPIFVTGGIGGVHRGAETSMDVSADLTELGRTPVCVICAGVKSILDIGLTLEYLETHGVAVVSYGKHGSFPSFFSQDSGFKAPLHAESAEDVASMIDSSQRLGIGSGMVVGVPIPDAFSIDGVRISSAIKLALKEASEAGVKGKEITPFVLKKVNDLTDGISLKANIGLIKHNAAVGADIAINLQKLKVNRVTVHSQKDVGDFSHKQKSTSNSSFNRKTKGKPIIIGACNVDIVAKADAFDVMAEATNNGHIVQTYGGVGRNVAECLQRLGQKPLLISAVGDDSQGRLLLDDMRSIDMDTDGVNVCDEHPTATYCAIVNSSGDLVMGIGDMNLHQSITPEIVSGFEERISQSPLVCVDGNISADTMRYVLKTCHHYKVPVWFEPTCIPKAKLPFTSWDHTVLQYASPNINELITMNACILNRQQANLNLSQSNEEPLNNKHLENIMKECIRLSTPLMNKTSNLIITLGKYGILHVTKEGSSNVTDDMNISSELKIVHYPICNDGDQIPIQSVSGAGDSFAGGYIAGLLIGKNTDSCVKIGMYAAALSLKCPRPISTSLSSSLLNTTTVENWYTTKPRSITNLV